MDLTLYHQIQSPSRQPRTRLRMTVCPVSFKIMPRCKGGFSVRWACHLILIIIITLKGAAMQIEIHLDLHWFSSVNIQFDKNYSIIVKSPTCSRLWDYEQAIAVVKVFVVGQHKVDDSVPPLLKWDSGCGRIRQCVSDGLKCINSHYELVA